MVAACSRVTRSSGQLAQFRLDKVPFEEVAALVLGTAREIQPRKKEQQE